MPTIITTPWTLPTSGIKSTNHGNGSTTWSSPSSITADNGLTSGASEGAGGGQTEDQIGRGFGFNIPADAEILGIESRFEIDGGGNASWGQVYLYDDETRIGDNQSPGGYLPSSWTLYDIGGSSDLWGATLTPTFVNSFDFGVGLRVGFVGSGSVLVDYYAMRVTYIAQDSLFNGLNF